MNLAPDDRKDLSGPWTGMWQIRLCGEQGKRTPEKAATAAAIGDLFPAPYSVQNGAPLEIIAKCKVRWKRPPVDFFSGRGWISGWEPESLTIASSDRRLMRDVTREWITELPSYETSFDGDLVDAMNASLLAVDPEARTVPYMLSGGTDAKHFARLGIRCFGFIPLRLPPDLDFAALFHGVDERVPIDSLAFGTEVLEHFLKNC